MKKIKSYRFDEEIINQVEKLAKENRRSATGQIEFMLLEYLKSNPKPQIIGDIRTDGE